MEETTHDSASGVIDILKGVARVGMGVAGVGVLIAFCLMLGGDSQSDRELGRAVLWMSLYGILGGLVLLVFSIGVERIVSIEALLRKQIAPARPVVAPAPVAPVVLVANAPVAPQNPVREGVVRTTVVRG